MYQPYYHPASRSHVSYDPHCHGSDEYQPNDRVRTVLLFERPVIK